MVTTCVRSYLCFKLVHLFQHYALSCVILIIHYGSYSFSRRRLPDVVTEELVFVLSQKRSQEFKQLFEVVHGNLRRRNAANGGEKMLRLRAYEKLQNLVFRGAVKKNGKVYTGDAAALAAMAANAPHVGAIASNLRVSGLLGRRGVSPVCRFGVFGRATDPARQ